MLGFLVAILVSMIDPLVAFIGIGAGWASAKRRHGLAAGLAGGGAVALVLLYALSDPTQAFPRAAIRIAATLVWWGAIAGIAHLRAPAKIN